MTFLRLFSTIMWVWGFGWSLLIPSLHGQQLFPVKKHNRWGLINQDGKIVVNPVYEAIGEFKKYQYAVMQRSGKVGLLNGLGAEIIPPAYEDLKVLDSTLFAVKKDNQWCVVNLHNEAILPKDVNGVRVLDNPLFLAYSRGDNWGLATRKGVILTMAVYDEIYVRASYFLVRKGDSFGLVDVEGQEILTPTHEEVRVINETVLLFKQRNKWGGVNVRGELLFPANFDRFKQENSNMLKLYKGEQLHLFSLVSHQLLSDPQYEEAYAIHERFLVVRRQQQLFLMDHQGNEWLSRGYEEILPYQGDLFRVRQEDKWGVAGLRDTALLPIVYDFVGPFQGEAALVKSGDHFGLANHKGELALPASYQKVELQGKQVRAYQQQQLHVFLFSGDGSLQPQSEFQEFFTVQVKKSPSRHVPSDLFQQRFVLPSFEWYYSPESGKWGLRKLEDGEDQIQPVFDLVQVHQDLNLTLVGLKRFNYLTFDRSRYRFDFVLGLVDNSTGRLISEVNLLDIRLEDWKHGIPLAHCVFENGTHGLISPGGQVVMDGLTYLEAYSDGLARFAVGGKLSGSLQPQFRQGLGKVAPFLNRMHSPATMVDYTQHDRQFHTDAYLQCAGCRWGYLDTTGKVRIAPVFQNAKPFLNEIAIVSRGEGKWGAVNIQEEEILPCEYDEVGFLENTNNEVLRIYKKESRYGLIDTLGRMAVKAVYEECGGFSENRLAVRRKGLWGFVNQDGIEIISCRFRRVGRFSEGLASVQMGTRWGFIDKQGNVQVSFEFLRAGDFHNGLAPVQMPKGFNYIDKTGALHIQQNFDRAYNFQQGIARVMEEGNYGLIDQQGKWVVRPHKYTLIQPFNRHGLAVVRYGNERVRYGIINREGQQLAGGFREIQPFREGLAAVKTNDGYGFIDTLGNVVIKDRFTDVSAFSEGRVAVREGGQCGYIDMSGNWIVPPSYYKCLDFKNGKAVVYTDPASTGLIDREGKEVIEPSIDRLLDFSNGRGLVQESRYKFYYITEQADISNGYYSSARKYEHGIAVVSVDDKWGVINQQGMEIIPPKYDRIEHFEDGYAKVRIRGFSGLTNKDGEFIIQPAYEYISYVGEGLFRVEQGDKVGYFDREGNWVWALD